MVMARCFPLQSFQADPFDFEVLPSGGTFVFTTDFQTLRVRKIDISKSNNHAPREQAPYSPPCLLTISSQFPLESGGFVRRISSHECCYLRHVPTGKRFTTPSFPQTSLFYPPLPLGNSALVGMFPVSVKLGSWKYLHLRAAWYPPISVPCRFRPELFTYLLRKLVCI